MHTAGRYLVLHRYVGRSGQSQVFIGDNSLRLETVQDGCVVGEPSRNGSIEVFTRVIDWAFLALAVKWRLWLRLRRKTLYILYSVGRILST